MQCGGGGGGGGGILFIFLLAKYIPMLCKNGVQKQEWRYPTACAGSYFIPDQMKIFRHI